MSYRDAYPFIHAAKVDKEAIPTGKPDCRPAGITSGVYNIWDNAKGWPATRKELPTPQPAGSEREWAYRNLPERAGKFTTGPREVSDARERPAVHTHAPPCQPCARRPVCAAALRPELVGRVTFLWRP